MIRCIDDTADGAVLAVFQNLMLVGNLPGSIFLALSRLRQYDGYMVLPGCNATLLHFRHRYTAPADIL